MSGASSATPPQRAGIRELAQCNKMDIGISSRSALEPGQP